MADAFRVPAFGSDSGVFRMPPVVDEPAVEKKKKKKHRQQEAQSGSPPPQRNARDAEPASTSQPAAKKGAKRAAASSANDAGEEEAPVRSKKARPDKAAAGVGAASPADGAMVPKGGVSGKNLGRRRRAFEKRQRERQQGGGAKLKPAAGKSGRDPSEPKAKGERKPKGERPAKPAAADVEAAVGVPAKLPKQPKQVAQPKLPKGKPAKPAGPTVAPPSSAAAPPSGGSSALMNRMRQQLSGGRFRYLNELLYTCTGDAALARVQQEPALMIEYHAGFRAQVEGWPQRPLERAAEWLARRPAGLHVADFGCGEAELASRSPQHSFSSMDLAVTAPGVIACDMAHTPMADRSTDVAVFCLSLMGTDYGAFLREAHRVLKPGGWLWIAEVRSRFAPVGTAEDEPEAATAGVGSGVLDAFVASLQRLGFKLRDRDESNRMFAVLVLRKSKDLSAQAPDDEALAWPALKPCTYKKR